ncbi:TPA: hypothetical protein ENS27_16870, partial [bacterium]|nr:hypothetical protein [bacterium]
MKRIIFELFMVLTIFGCVTTGTSSSIEELTEFGDHMILVEGGSFKIGDSNYGPPNKRTVNDFWLGSSEVENYLFSSIMNWALRKGYIFVENGSIKIKENGKNIMVEKGIQGKQYRYDIEQNRIIMTNSNGYFPVTG